HQCGLPKLMALELFKPFIMSRLVERKSVQNIKAAKKYVDSMVPEVWDVLEEVIAEHPVLLNRAPTLHRLGIQAFEPVLAEAKQVGIQQPIEYRWNGELVLTTAGRVIFNSEVERSLQEATGDGDSTRHDFINRTLSKKEMGEFISELVDRYGAHAIASVLDTIKSLGFAYATQGGITISKNDIVIPPDKEPILADFEERVGKVEQQYTRGLITEEERHEIIVNLWTEATEAVADATERSLHELNPIYMMANSG